MKKYLDNQYHTKSRRIHIGDCVLVTMTKQAYAIKFKFQKSISSLRAKVQALVPKQLKQSMSLTSFKQDIKKWKPSNCPCRLCKAYVQNADFIYLIIPVAGFQLRIKEV